MNIFVAKLNFKTSSEQLRALFAQYGEVTLAKVVTDRDTGRSKGFGFVEMSDDDAAREAISKLDETEFDGATLAVKEATPREDRKPSSFNRDRPSGGGGGGYSQNRSFDRRSGGGGGGGNSYSQDRRPRDNYDDRSSRKPYNNRYDD